VSTDDPGTPEAISVDELAAWRRDGTAHGLLDVREVYELAICGIEGAAHIPMAQISARLAELPRDAPLVVLCHHGMRSQSVVNYLRRAGFLKAVNLAGGIDDWAARIDQNMARY
jgi:rhodanese-related sulfurtransferase